MQNVLITLEYDGSRYSGWQIQKNTDRTIQKYLEDVLAAINKTPVRVTGAGRTDAGVHALGQAASFKLDVDIPVSKITRAMNRLLPPDIVCKEARLVDPDFHARYNAKGKFYRYRILNRKLGSAFLYKYVYHHYTLLNLKLMQQAGVHLEGTHDFASFQSSGSSVEDTVRTIRELRVIDRGPEIWIEVKGDGFLYNMVRIIAGTLIEVGEGKLEVEDVKDIVKKRDRGYAGFTAPASGLFLIEVYYDF